MRFNLRLRLVFELYCSNTRVYRQTLFSVSKKTTNFQPEANKKLREQGLLQLKTKEFTSVNDCIQLERNAVMGVFL